MLRYLFEAHFEDGTFLRQTQEDRATLVPQGSAFTDVLEKSKSSRLVLFGLAEEGGNNAWVVDLLTGTFACNGAAFLAHDPRHQIPEGAHLRPIYFRRVTRQFNPVDNSEVNVHVLFNLGYQWTDKDGHNHQQVIAFV